MTRKPEQYVIGILFSTETTIKYVTNIQSKSNIARWDDGEEAKIFSKEYAKELAFGLCLNGYAAVPIIKADYLNLINPKQKL